MVEARTKHILVAQRNENQLEIVQHALFCKNLLKNFIERPVYTIQVYKIGYTFPSFILMLTHVLLILSIKLLNYITDKHNNKPFVIYGPSGSGKSTIMASLVQMVSEKLFIIKTKIKIKF